MSGEPRGLTRQQMCDRLAMEFADGWIVNLGVGIPTLCSNYDCGDRLVIFHSENGVIGYGALAKPGAHGHLVGGDVGKADPRQSLRRLVRLGRADQDPWLSPAAQLRHRALEDEPARAHHPHVRADLVDFCQQVR